MAIVWGPFEYFTYYFIYYYSPFVLLSIIYLGALKFRKLEQMTANIANSGPRSTLTYGIGIAFTNIGLLIIGIFYPLATIYWALSHGLAKIGHTVNFDLQLENSTDHDETWNLIKSKKLRIILEGKEIEPASYEGKSQKKNKIDSK